jgi:hypothetical protein
MVARMAPAYHIRHRPRAAPGPRLADDGDPARELCERASELLEATQRLRRGAAAPGSWPAIAAALGCVEAALNELSEAVADMGLHASTRTGGAAATATRDLFERLRLQLTLAQSTCGAARDNAGSLLDSGPEEAA